MCALMACSKSKRDIAIKEIERAESAGDVAALVEIISRKANDENATGSYYQSDELEKYSIDALAAIALKNIVNDQPNEKKRIEELIVSMRDGADAPGKSKLLNNAIGLLNEDAMIDMRSRTYRSAEAFITGERRGDARKSQNADREDNSPEKSNPAESEHGPDPLPLKEQLENSALLSQERALELRMIAAQAAEGAKVIQQEIAFTERQIEDLRREAAELSDVSSRSENENTRVEIAQAAIAAAEDQLVALQRELAVYDAEAQNAAIEADAMEAQAMDDLALAETINDQPSAREQRAPSQANENSDDFKRTARVLTPVELGLPNVNENTVVDAIVVLSKSGSDRDAYTTASANANFIRWTAFAPELIGQTSIELEEVDANLSLLGVVYRYDEYHGTYGGDCEGTAYRVNAHLYVIDLAQKKILSGRSLRGDTPPLSTQTVTFGNAPARCDDWGIRPNHREFLSLRH